MRSARTCLAGREARHSLKSGRVFYRNGEDVELELHFPRKAKDVRAFIQPDSMTPIAEILIARTFQRGRPRSFSPTVLLFGTSGFLSIPIAWSDSNIQNSRYSPCINGSMIVNRPH